MSDINNPLDGLQIGSCTPAGSGKKWGDSVIRGQVTITDVQTTKWASMQGQSDYVYTKKMNQASSGVSGSYGVSGVSKVSSALSAYIGISSAQSGMSMKVNYQVIVRGGVEHISFDDLTPADLINALSDGAKNQITNALDAYIILNDRLKNLSVDEPKLFSVLQESKNYVEEYKLFQNWLKLVNNFKTTYGDGMVVRVAWGGIGVVSMEIKKKSNDSVWKYGGEANFSYAGPGASVSVGATYDGSQSEGKADVTVECTQFSSGAPVQAQTDAWFKTVSELGFKELADVKVLEKAPDMTAKAIVQKPPKFKKPKSDKKLTDKIEKIKNLDGLKAYAKAAAYDQAKKKDKNLTLDQFLESAEKKADDSGVKAVIKVIQSDSKDDSVDGPFIIRSSLSGGHMDVSEMSTNDSPTSAVAASGPFVGYTPIAVWITNWDQLFPWLATGFLNSISDDDVHGIKASLAYRTMLQDFQTLAKLYYIANSCHLSPKVFPKDCQVVDNFKQYANSFARQVAILQEKLVTKLISGPAPEPDFYACAMESAENGLNEAAKRIYKLWRENGFLRKCELGMGIMGGDSITESSSGNFSPQINDNGKSSVERLNFRFSSSIALFSGTGLGIYYAQGCGDEKNKNRSRFFTAPRKTVLFDPIKENPDYSVFANFYKVLPLIVPFKDEMKIYALGPGNNLLGYLNLPQTVSSENPYGVNVEKDITFFEKNPDMKTSFIFIGDNGVGEFREDNQILTGGLTVSGKLVPCDLIEFKPNAKSKTLEGKGVKLYPIPFSAAQNVSWKGMSFSTNVGSQTDLKSTLENFQNELKNRNHWGFSSDSWPDNWDMSEIYNAQNIPEQYIGLLDKAEYESKGL